MNDESQTIEQRFQQMVESDPNNELGHFSLGKVYLEAGRFDDAIPPLSRVLELNPKMSKAYELLGEAYESAGKRDQAIEVVTRGVSTADELGDRKPRDAMAKMLEQWGAAVPAFKEEAAQPQADPGATGLKTVGFQCARCSRPDGQLPKPPIRGPLGVAVHAQTCAACWQEWIGMGTKVINELGISLSTPAGQEAYDQYMVEFLQLELS